MKTVKLISALLLFLVLKQCHTLTCAPGNYTDPVSSTCVACTGQFYCPDGTSALFCPGSIVYANSTDPNTATGCTPCQSTQYFSNTTKACTACPVGFACSGGLKIACYNGNATSTPYTIGTIYQDASSQSTCKICDAPRVAFNSIDDKNVVYSRSCAACAPGSVPNTAALLTSTASAACSDCAIGFACPDGLNQIQCNASLSQYQDTASSTMCKNCTNGIVPAGQNKCVTCPPGSFIAASGTCSNCTAGSYCPGNGRLYTCNSVSYATANSTSCAVCNGALSADKSVCTPCPAMQYFAKKLGSCRACPPSTYSQPGASKCTFCAGLINTTVINGTNTSMCDSSFARLETFLKSAIENIKTLSSNNTLSDNGNNNVVVSELMKIKSLISSFLSKLGNKDVPSVTAAYGNASNNGSDCVIAINGNAYVNDWSALNTTGTLKGLLGNIFASSYTQAKNYITVPNARYCFALLDTNATSAANQAITAAKNALSAGNGLGSLIKSIISSIVSSKANTPTVAYNVYASYCWPGSWMVSTAAGSDPEGVFTQGVQYCLKCQTGCVSCSLEDSCLSCSPDYELATFTKNVTTKVGSKTVTVTQSYNACSPICTDAQYKTDSNTCSNCAPGCASCDKDGCLACYDNITNTITRKNGRFVCGDTCTSGSYYDTDQDSCVQCTAGTSTCSGKTNAQSCLAGYTLTKINDTNSICSYNCPAGTYSSTLVASVCNATSIKSPSALVNALANVAKSKLCKALSSQQCSSCPAGCSSCLSSSVCTACSYGFSLSDGQCISQCPAGQYLTAEAICTSCSKNCASCVDVNTCTTCNSGYALLTASSSSSLLSRLISFARQGTSSSTTTTTATCQLTCSNRVYRKKADDFRCNGQCAKGCLVCTGPTMSECTTRG